MLDLQQATINARMTHRQWQLALDYLTRIGVKLEGKYTDTGGKHLQATAYTREQYINERWPELVGRGITLSEASEKYGPSQPTIYRWVKKNRWISEIGNTYPMHVDEAQVAYLASVYNQRKAAGSLTGAPLLDENGLPYELMHPELSERRKLEAA